MQQGFLQEGLRTMVLPIGWVGTVSSKQHQEDVRCPAQGCSTQSTVAGWERAPSEGNGPSLREHSHSQQPRPPGCEPSPLLLGGV